MVLLGAILIAIGIIAFVYEGITYTKRGKPVDLGIMEVSTKTSKRIPLSPIVGVVALIGGIALLTIKT